MQTLGKNRRQSNVRSRLGATVLGIALSLSLAAGTAQAFVFHDPIHTLQNVITQVGTRIEELAKYKEMITDGKEQIQQQINTLQDLQAKLTSFQSFLETQPDVDLKEVDEKTFMVKERCGDAGGSGAGAVINALTGIDVRGDVFKQQYQVCTATQIMRNKQFNITVRYLKKSMQTAVNARNELNNLSTKTNESGTKADAIRIAEQTSMELDQNQKKFENELAAYQRYIDIQEKTQSALATSAMRGNAGTLTKVASAAIMTAALCNSGQCSNSGK